MEEGEVGDWGSGNCVVVSMDGNVEVGKCGSEGEGNSRGDVGAVVIHEFVGDGGSAASQASGGGDASGMLSVRVDIFIRAGGDGRGSEVAVSIVICGRTLIESIQTAVIRYLI